jgi:hypothetical protein
MICRSCEHIGRAVSIRILAVWFLYFLRGHSLSRVPIANVNRKVTLCTSSSRIKFLYIYRLITYFIATVIIYKNQRFYIPGSVHHTINHLEITNNMRPCIRIYCSVSYCSTCFERHIVHHHYTLYNIILKKIHFLIAVRKTRGCK